MDVRPMNFAERLLSGQIRLIQRKPQVGDVVVSPSDRIYEVTLVLTDYRDRPDLYEVISLEDGRGNAFRPDEIQVLAVTEAKTARAYYEQTREV